MRLVPVGHWCHHLDNCAFCGFKQLCQTLDAQLDEAGFMALPWWGQSYELVIRAQYNFRSPLVGFQPMIVPWSRS